MTTVPDSLDRRFRDAAAAEGLLDVAYDFTDSPVGRLLVAASERGICRISFDPEPERELEALARAFGARVLRTPGPVDDLRRELDEYFEGARREFDLQVDLSPLPGFQRSVLEELVRVPYGHVDTYGGLAQRIGKPRAARAVGGALNRNPVPIVVPCHRIVGASGSLVGYAGGLERKETLLGLEGAILA
ncbi:MAG TPA: methylated-DNA--[protein]-cysteine S-methyltransferase [Gaiellaceae bacterium]|nr:methylated-DNA--[protein]-cysteine S-methyltransferase [Gaiellaceae bacterium]HXV94957.1 methylated-DNA--[protein]-cysteine S-methyltransferase [Gaiellaceae bacterium]